MRGYFGNTASNVVNTNFNALNKLSANKIQCKPELEIMIKNGLVWMLS